MSSYMFYNRDLSWLDFNYRVLQEAMDETVPLFERLKFLSIFSSNLDEFFRVRYPSIIALPKLKEKTKQKALLGSPDDVLTRIQDKINSQLDLFGSTLRSSILPALERHGVVFYYNTPLKEEHREQAKEIFLSHILSYLRPIFLDTEAGRDFMPENNQLYFSVTLEEAKEGFSKQAIVNIPAEKVGRFVTLWPIANKSYVVFIDDIIRENIALLFPGFNVTGVYSIKLNRNAELRLYDQYTGDLLNKIEKQLQKRDFAPPSRFLYEQGMPTNIQLYLAGAFSVKTEDLFAGSRYHNLKDLASFPCTDKNLFYPTQQHLKSWITSKGDIFKRIEERDLLLHLPYQSYNPVLIFFNQAAVDVHVTHIYITLYRVAADSHIINALISAAKNGKAVTVFIELKARFDEANNIRWSKLMKEAGVHLVYSSPSIKVHSKIAIVRKQDGNTGKDYAILSTGNFNEKTAVLYTDHVLFTTNRELIEDALSLLDLLKQRNKAVSGNEIVFRRLLVSQFNLLDRFEDYINKEVKKVQNGQKALIRIKVNNLEEPYVISLLYKASQNGVPIHLIVRSVCCLVPGLPGTSEHILIKRIVDRYLEHTRIWIFGADENAEVIIGSADLMNRNIYNRIEVATPILDNGYRKQLLDYFEIQWSDNDKAVMILPNTQQERLPVNEQNRLNAQQDIYNYLETAL